MAICNEQLKTEDKPYPRTCAKCGLGPCKEVQRQGNAALKTIAGLIQKLSYRDMMDLSDFFAKHTNKIQGDIGPRDMAVSLLEAADEILHPPAAKMPMPAPGDWRR
jgi:hypothetical protein